METRHREHVPRKTNQSRTPPLNWWLRAALALAFWTALGLLLAIQSYLLWPKVTFAEAVYATMPRCYLWGLLAPFIFTIDHRILGRLTAARRILAHIPLAILFTSIAMALEYAIQRTFHVGFGPDAAGQFFLQNFFAHAMIYAVIVGASVATGYAREARRREHETAKLALHSAQLETHLAEARLRALQSQLNPHFLFNAFNSISAFTETDPKTARRMMARLGALLRSSLDHAGRQEVTLAEELSFLEDYLTIERLRFEDRLTVRVSVEDGARDALVPSFVLQPLVENAIRHGTGALLRPGHVNVCARRMDARLGIEVEDDGIGLPEGWRLEDHAGIGLSNIARRLEELYKSGYSFVVCAREAGGVRVCITLPYRRREQGAAPLRSATVDVT